MTMECTVILLMSGNAPCVLKGRDFCADQVMAIGYRSCVLLGMQYRKPMVPLTFQTKIRFQKIFIMPDVSMHY